MDNFIPLFGFFDSTLFIFVENGPHPSVISFHPHDPHPPPNHPYTQAQSSYSAVVQLYARSDQLGSALTLYTQLHGGQP